METFKRDLLNNLHECLNQVKQYEQKLNLDFSWYKEKLEKAIKTVSDEKIKIAFFGSFSDGKSTILAALTGNLGIEIAPEPTTDKVQHYHYKDFYIIDTPGLFSENKPHDEKTLKFISEADLIIFTLDAVNPLKESQHEVVRWILKDLGKIHQTVFVINKMDTVADIYDEEDFKEKCEIKKQTVKETLNKILNEERSDYIIICLSADPWGMGLKYWLEKDNREEYLKLSRLKTLEEILETVIQEKQNKLKETTLKSILKDISTKGIKELGQKRQELEEQVKKLEMEYKELDEELKKINRELNKAVTRIKENLINKRVDIVTAFSACSDYNCLTEAFNTYIGNDGIALKSSIEIIIEKEIEPIYDYIDQTVNILEKIKAQIENIDLTFAELTKLGIPILEKTGQVLSRIPTKTLRDSILTVRNTLRIPIKFKPWGALKLAKALGYLGAALEALATILKIYRDIKFQKIKQEIITNLDNFFKEVVEGINTQFIKENYFPSLLKLEQSANELEKALSSYKEFLVNLQYLEIFFKKCEEVIK